MESQDLKNLADLIEKAKQIEDVLSSNAHGKNPFAMQWNDINATRTIHMDQKVLDQWHLLKVKAAKKFLSLIKKQISADKKKLGMR